MSLHFCFFFFQAEDGIRDYKVTGVQTCALPICGIYSTAIPSLGMRITWERAAPYSGSMLKQGIFHSLPSNNMTIELVKTGELTSGGSLNGSFARIYSGTSNARDLLATVFRSEERRVGKECRSRWSP